MTKKIFALLIIGFFTFSVANLYASTLDTKAKIEQKQDDKSKVKKADQNKKTCCTKDGKCKGKDGKCCGKDGKCCTKDGKCKNKDGKCCTKDGKCKEKDGKKCSTKSSCSKTKSCSKKK